MTRSRSSFVLAVSIALVVFVACGGGGKKNKTSATTTTSVGADFCTLSREYVERTQAALAQDIADARANPTAFQGRVRDDFRAADKQIGQLAATAPSQIATDMNSAPVQNHHRLSNQRMPRFYRRLRSRNKAAYRPPSPPPARRARHGRSGRAWRRASGA